MLYRLLYIGNLKKCLAVPEITGHPKKQAHFFNEFKPGITVKENSTISSNPYGSKHQNQRK